MIDYMSIEEQVEADFVRARRKAWLRRLLSHLTRSPASGRPACFAEAGERLGVAGGVRAGRRDVRSEDIVGTVGRCFEFGADFLPLSRRASERWGRIDRAFRRGDELPPVSLYEIDGSYFVLDGNHRVSVARYHGVEWLDAEVTAFRARSPGTGDAGATSPTARTRPPWRSASRSVGLGRLPLAAGSGEGRLAIPRSASQAAGSCFGPGTPSPRRQPIAWQPVVPGDARSPHQPHVSASKPAPASDFHASDRAVRTESGEEG